MVQFTGRRAPDPNLFGEYREALIDGQKVSCHFTDEALQDLREISPEDIVEFCKGRIQQVNGAAVLRITTDDLRGFRNRANRPP